MFSSSSVKLDKKKTKNIKHQGLGVGGYPDLNGSTTKNTNFCYLIYSNKVLWRIFYYDKLVAGKFDLNWSSPKGGGGGGASSPKGGIKKRQKGKLYKPKKWGNKLIYSL